MSSKDNFSKSEINFGIQHLLLIRASFWLTEKEVGILFCKVCISTSCCVQVSLLTSNRSPSPDMMTKASHCDRSASLASSRAWLCRSERHTPCRSIETVGQPLQTLLQQSQPLHAQPWTHEILNAVSCIFFSLCMLPRALKIMAQIDNP